MPTKVEDCATFLGLLKEATKGVEDIYFRVPIDGGTPIYRERVYCYELYHQVRLLWPSPKDWRYFLGGEVDKRGHEIMKDKEADQSIPDLLVHVPGRMDDNLVIVEVKKADGLDLDNVTKDLNKLAKFVADVDYVLGIYLVYGGDAGTVERVRELAERWASKRRDEILAEDRPVEPGRRTLNNIVLLHHAEPGERASEKTWESDDV